MLVFGDAFFTDPIEEIYAYTTEDIFPALERLDSLRLSKHLVGYIRYEAYHAFLPRPSEHKSPLPLLYFAAFNKAQKFVSQEISEKGNVTTIPGISFERYHRDIHKIKEAIAAGRTYQVNYTYSCKVNATAYTEWELYQLLRNKQPTPYSAFIQNKKESILSFSPELFFEVEDKIIQTRPMKGTAPRGKTTSEDKHHKEFLRTDTKNRAENLMIVDLLRNDIGRICEFGSVKVPHLYSIESHPTLHQMTSTVAGRLKDKTSLKDILTALFPCGSITGAPKIETMKIIESLERRQRGVYCGTIAYMNPQKMCFSVPIRMLQKDKKDSTWTYSVGSGIVWDSSAEGEWKECYTKTEFMNSIQKNFDIVESMLVENGHVADYDLHMERMEKTAKFFNFPFSRTQVPKPQGNGKLRYIMDRSGSITMHVDDLGGSSVHKAVISKDTLDSSNDFLRHKTSYKPWYEAALKRVMSGEVYDVIFFNEKGELCEGARSNIMIEKNGRCYTPPISCGLLPGTYRRLLLEKGICTEKILTKEDLLSADHIYSINSVRGQVELFLED
jgi:para-aminobenzoate synthetase/4-amino-4-deoxychorismate lyase